MIAHAWKALHLLAATVFLGDVLTTFLWNLRAARSRDPRVRAFAGELVMLTDRWLLTPAVFVLVVTGNVTAFTTGVPLWHDPLLASSVVLFIACGLVWALFLVPVQKRQLAMSAELRTGDTVPEAYDALHRRWMSWAPVALGLGVLSQVLMALA